MAFIFIFSVELLLLFLLARTLVKELSSLFYLLTYSKTVTIYLSALLFLPGTLIHELAHLMVAWALRVPVVDIELLPKMQTGRVTLGSVVTGKTDPLRTFAIGVAPFLVGIFIILLTLVFIQQHSVLTNGWATFFVFYILFAISNSMFSSRKDLEGALELIIATVIVLGTFYLFGLRVNLDFLRRNELLGLFEKGSVLLLVPLGIDVTVIAIAKFFSTLYRPRRI